MRGTEPENRRLHPRTRVNNAAILEHWQARTTRPLGAMTADVSHSGLFLLTDHHLPEGSLLTVGLDASASATAICAVVRQVDRLGVGCRFVGLSTAAEQWIARSCQDAAA